MFSTLRGAALAAPLPLASLTWPVNCARDMVDCLHCVQDKLMSLRSLPDQTEADILPVRQQVHSNLTGVTLLLCSATDKRSVSF
jgi:hypothetical protein